MAGQPAWCGTSGMPGACLSCLAAARLAYLGVQVFRLEALLTYVGALCLTGLGQALLILGMMCGVGTHVASLALLARKAAAVRHPPTWRQRKESGSLAGGGACPSGVPSLPWLQRLVVPISLAGLVLELLSGAPAKALPYSRTLALLVMLSIAFQRDPFWSVLPQLAAALVLDFGAFLAALLTGRYDTPNAVLKHLLPSMAAAIGVLALAPLCSSLTPRAAPSGQRQDEGVGQGLEQRHRSSGGMAEAAAAAEGAPMPKSSAATRRDVGEVEAEEPLASLPPGVVQQAERSLRPAYRRLVFLERSATALLLTCGALWGADGAGGLAAIRAGLLIGGGAASGGSAGVPLHHARTAAAALACAAASTLLLLNGLLAAVPGRLYAEHAVAVNTAVTGLHAASQLAALVMTPPPRGRGAMLRAMVALAANLVGNGDPWVGFLAQLATLLGAVTALDAWLAPWGPPPHRWALGGPSATSSGAPWPGWVAHLGGASASGPEVGSMQCRAGAMGAADGGGGPAADTDVSALVANGHWLAAISYVVVAAAAVAFRAHLPRGRHAVSYRLYRRFYLPASYGGACVTVPLPASEATQIRTVYAGGDGAAGELTERPSSTWGSGAATHASSMLLPPGSSLSNGALSGASGFLRDHYNITSRRSVSLKEMAQEPGPAAAAAVASFSAGGAAAGIAGAGGGGGGLVQGSTSRFSTSPVMAMQDPPRDTGVADAAATGGAGTAAGASGSIASTTQASGSGSQGLTGFQRLMGTYSSPFTAIEAATAQQTPAPAVAPVLGSGQVTVAAAAAAPPPRLSGVAMHANANAGPRGSNEQEVLLASESGGSLLASALDLDEADVISGKIDFQGQLCKLAGLSSSAAAGRELDRLLQVLGSNGTSSSANTSSLPGAPLARPGPSRSPSDISNLLAAARIQYTDYGAYPVSAGTAGGTHSPSRGGAGGGASAGGGGGGSFLASMAASMSSAPTGGGSGSGDGVSPAAGNRLARLRGAPARAASDLAVWRQHIQQQHQQSLQQHPQQGAKTPHRPPRRSPSDVSYLGPRHRTAGTVAVPGASPPLQPLQPLQPLAAGMNQGGVSLHTLLTSATQGLRLGSGSTGPVREGMSPPLQQQQQPRPPSPRLQQRQQQQARPQPQSAQPPEQPPTAGQHGGRAAVAPAAERPHAAPVVPPTAGGAKGAVAAAAGVGAGGVGPERGGPARRPSRHFAPLLDTTGLALLGQNLITIGSSSGGPSNVLINSMTQSPTFQERAARAGDRPAGLAAALHAAGTAHRAEPHGGAAVLRPARSAPTDAVAASPVPGGAGIPPPLKPVLSHDAAAAGQTGARATEVAGHAARGQASWDDERLRQLGYAIRSMLDSDIAHEGLHRSTSSSRKAHAGSAEAGAADAPRSGLHRQISPPSSSFWQDMHVAVAAAAAAAAQKSAGQTPAPLVRSDSAPRDVVVVHNGRPGYNRQVSEGRVVSAGNLGGSGAASSRPRTRVSWSDLEARGSGGSTGTASVASGGSRASLSNGAVGGGAAAAAAADGAGRGRRARPSPPSPPPVQRFLRSNSPQPYTQPHQHYQQHQQQQQHRQHSHSIHHEFFGQAQTQWQRGPGSNASSMMLAEVEQARNARELASLWTSSSVGDASFPSQHPSTMSSVAAAAAAAAAVAAAVAAASADASPSGTRKTADGPGRILSAVQEVPEVDLPSGVHESGGDDGGSDGSDDGGEEHSKPPLVRTVSTTRHRRLSQVVAPGPPRPASRAGSRKQLASKPTSQAQLQLPSGGCDSAAVETNAKDKTVPARALRLAGELGTAASGGGGSGGTTVPSSPNSASQAAAVAAAWLSAAGGSMGTGGTGGSTNMSFDNWANADDLAAVLLGATKLPGTSSGQIERTGSATAPSPRALQQLGTRGRSLQQLLAFPEPTQPREELSAQWLKQQTELQSRTLMTHDTDDGRGEHASDAESMGSATSAGYTVAAAAVAASAAVAAPTPVYGDVASGSSPRGHMARVMDHVQPPARAPPTATAAGMVEVSGGGGGGFPSSHHPPSRSPSVPNMTGRAGWRPLFAAHGAVRRSSSMGKSRLGSIASSTSSFPLTQPPTATSSPTPSGAQAYATVTAAANAASLQQQRQPSPGPSPPQLPLRPGPLGRSPSAAALGAKFGGSANLDASDGSVGALGTMLGLANGSSAPPPMDDIMDSYSDYPPMRSSQAALAAALPYSILRGSIMGAAGGGMEAEADGEAGAGEEVAALLGARGGGGGMEGSGGAAVGLGLGWPQEATAEAGARHRLPFRRASLDERTMKQMVAVRRLLPSLSPGQGRLRARRRSSGLAPAQEYVPSRLSQDGRLLPGGVAGLPVRRTGSGSGPSLGPALGPSLQAAFPGRPRSMETPHLYASAQTEGATALRGGEPSAAAAGLRNLAAPRASAAGSVATTAASQVTASSTSLQSFADVALGGVHYF